MQSIRRALPLAVLVMVLAAGCDEKGNTFLPRPIPPVTVTYRDSLVGVGKVIQITNNSNHHLYDIKVVGRNIEQKSSASVKATEHLRPGESIEVGWMEFEAWAPAPGETVEIYCEDFAVPYVSIVPQSVQARSAP
jgi:hypothetical protein